MRPPYFHNRMVANLNEVVRFYIQRFDVRLSDGDQAELVALLASL
jgi:cytochrome c peroxidase